MPQSQQLTDEDFAGWLGHPVTRAMMAWLERGRREAGRSFIDGALIMDNQWGSAMKQAEVIGRCVMAQTIIDLELSQLGTEDEE